MIFKIVALSCIISFTHLFAGEVDIAKIKTAIKVHFKNKNIIFLHINKTKDNNYFAIIKYDKIQDRITITKEGKILSIVDDLSVADEVEEGC